MSDFKRIFSESVVHDTNQLEETFCTTEFVPPHLYPFESLSLRTWRFHRLPSDLKIESKGCKLVTKVKVEEEMEVCGISMPQVHTNFTEFRLVSDGFLSVTSGGVEARVTWKKKEDNNFILTDFEGRQALVTPLAVREIISEEEEKQWQVNQDKAKKVVRRLKAMSALAKNMNLSDS